MNKAEFAAAGREKTKATLEKHFGVEGPQADQLLCALENDNVFGELANLAEAGFSAPNGCIVIRGHMADYKAASDKDVTIKITTDNTRETRHLLADLVEQPVFVRSLTDAEQQAYARAHAPKAEPVDHPDQMTLDEAAVEDGEDDDSGEDKRLGTKFENDSRMSRAGVFLDEFTSQWAIETAKKLNLAINIRVTEAGEDDWRYGLQVLDLLVTDESHAAEPLLDFNPSIESQQYNTEDDALRGAVAELREFVTGTGRHDGGDPFDPTEVRAIEKSIVKWAKDNGIELDVAAAEEAVV